MQLEQLATVVARFKTELPKKLIRDLEDVEILLAPDVAAARATLADLLSDGENPDPEVVGHINSDVPADCRGIFLGDPLTKDASDGEDEDEETITLPEGFVVLVASNIADEHEAAIVLLHETGHALGMSEAEVAQLGLGGTPAKVGPMAVEALPQ